MKYNIIPDFPGRCKITLVPESDAEKALAKSKDEEGSQQVADTFQLYYQGAITSKFGKKALLMSIDEINYPLTVMATYIMEGSGLGNTG